MSLIESLASYWRLPDSRPTREIQAEIREELEFHLAMAEEANLEAGLGASEARQDALHRFGDLATIETTCRRIQLGERRILQRVQAALVVFIAIGLLSFGVQTYRYQIHRDAQITELRQSVQQLQDSLTMIVGRAPPVVIDTYPVAGAVDVDPAASEIRVTFSKPMMDQSWSWCQTEHPFPKSVGPIRYLPDQRTCVMPVKLEPSTQYVLSLNSPHHGNFKDEYGRAAEPYVLSFTTKNPG